MLFHFRPRIPVLFMCLEGFLLSTRIIGQLVFKIAPDQRSDKVNQQGPQDSPLFVQIYHAYSVRQLLDVRRGGHWVTISLWTGGRLMGHDPCFWIQISFKTFTATFLTSLACHLGLSVDGGNVMMCFGNIFWLYTFFSITLCYFPSLNGWGWQREWQAG